jgi:RNA ligase
MNMRFEIDRKYIESKLVDEKKHPTLPLVIYNYTPTCQFSRAWDEVTTQCRGLIVHEETKEIIARPFPKFFNYEEHIERGDKLPEETPVVYAKFDGSLGILYFWCGEPHVATRGSFTSEQALWATDYVRKSNLWQNLDRDYTHLFEIIYPENRIVVSYDFEGLIHLASIHTETGKSIAPDSDFLLAGTLPFSSYQEIKALNSKNEEGFVLHYPESDFRVKIKFEDYVRLHKVVTGLSQIGIWEMLKDGIDPHTQDIPDEMYAWLSGVVEDLRNKYSEIETIAKEVVTAAKKLETRKEQAIFINEYENSGVAFLMLDGKDYSQVIWKMIRPKGALSFRKDIDA